MFVVPAKAGTQGVREKTQDSRSRENDGAFWNRFRR